MLTLEKKRESKMGLEDEQGVSNADDGGKGNIM